MAKTAAAVKEEPRQETAAPAQQSADTIARAEQGLPPKGTEYAPTPKADQIRQLPADRGPNFTPNIGIHFVEHQQGRGIGLGQHGLEGEHHAGGLAAGGDLV